MRPDRASRSWLPSLALWGLLWCLGGCQRDAPQEASSRGRALPKSGAVWGRDLASGLGLQTWELCTELGTFDCIDNAHLITLGGVEPEVLGIDEPLEHASVSAPMAVERVAIAACGERLARDRTGPAVVFGPVLERSTARHRREVSEVLIQRLLSRPAEKDEARDLADLYDTIEPISDDPVRDWSIAACVVVATSTEALFY